MKEQPVKKEELEKRIKISRTQLWRTLELLKHEKIIEESPKGFVLVGFSELDAKVSVALKEFKDMEYEAVGVYDLANKVSEPPSTVEASAFKLAGTFGLRIEADSRMKRTPIKTEGV